MTRAAVILCSLLALAGCDEETIENLVEGKVEVFTIHSASTTNLTGVPDGYHTWAELQNLNVDLPENAPFGTRDDLVNAVGDVTDSGCAKIPETSGVCFKEGDTSSCLPTELTEVGLKTYKIDLSSIEDAINAGFYPTAVQYLDQFGLNSNLSIEDAECSAIE
ncbi:hypothetical protein [Photobacterium halotolerans]|uniref:hypothetical protein n=1 Tax=Photobacterium halotolerans TaxID=265726 RepID=UPI000696459F|nr:hypothetical protein [Photobacterium halotolerans]